jgi:hypothetical protein
VFYTSSKYVPRPIELTTHLRNIGKPRSQRFAPVRAECAEGELEILLRSLHTLPDGLEAAAEVCVGRPGAVVEWDGNTDVPGKFPGATEEVPGGFVGGVESPPAIKDAIGGPGNV